ncbi:MAG: AIR synthase-related protein [Wujia sp.]
MEQGSLTERILSRSVLKHIRKQNKALIDGAAVGQDYASFMAGAAEVPSGSRNETIITEAVSADPCIAWTKALNNFACSGGNVFGARLVIILPDGIEEPFIKKYMGQLNACAEQSGIQILGGHTRVDKTCGAAQFVVTMLGMSGSYVQDVRGICPGFDVVMTKQAGLLGTDMLARHAHDRLRERFAESYIRGAQCDRAKYSVVPEAGAVEQQDGYSIFYMHDVSYGGVYGALWQAAVRMGKGIEAVHNRIPIRQETIELCEYFNLNPYMMDGTGSLLMVTDNGEMLVRQLEDRGIRAAVIGKVTADQDKTIVIDRGEADSGEDNGENIEKRYLSPVLGDEIYKVLPGNLL